MKCDVVVLQSALICPTAAEVDAAAPTLAMGATLLESIMAGILTAASILDTSAVSMPCPDSPWCMRCRWSHPLS
jgi:hypothetical protein